MVDAMAVPFFEGLETAHTVRATPSLLGRKLFKAFGKMLLAWAANLVLLLAAAIVALISVRRYVMSKEPLFGIVHWLWRRTERARGDLLTLTLFLLVTR